MKAAIKAIEVYFPQGVLTNEQLTGENAAWSAKKIYEKTGIRERRIAAPDECASDLAVAAAGKLLESAVCDRASVDYLLYCTQSPDYLLPSTACLIHERLGLKSSCGALDYNLGCSGYVYGLSLAKGLIESGQSNHVLLITAETYSKYIHPEDRSLRALFGDAAAVTLVSGLRQNEDLIGPFVFGTDGKGAEHLIVPAGGMRRPKVFDVEVKTDNYGNRRTENNLFMDGPEIFNFTLKVVPETVGALLGKSKKTLDEIDLFVFHQANEFMLQILRKKISIPEEKFILAMERCGNTVSSSIPIALRDAHSTGRLKSGQWLVLIGFGVGYSWGGALVRWLE